MTQPLRQAAAGVLKAEALLGDGRMPEAIEALQTHLRRQPKDGVACGLLGLLLTSTGDRDKGVYFAERARLLASHDPRVLEYVGHVMAIVGRSEEAIAAFRAALAIDPEQPGALQGLAMIRSFDQAHHEVLDLTRRALKHKPDDGRLIATMATATLGVGRADEAVGLMRQAAQREPDDVAVWHGLATTMNYVDGAPPAEIAHAHRQFGRLVERIAGDPLPPRNPRTRKGPLRVGFLSPDLRSHSCAYFIEPLVRNLDRAQFTPIAFSSTSKEDRVTAHLKTLFSEWHNVHALKDRAAAELVRSSDIDILLDLCGLTTGERLGIVALRPATVHATYLGYPNTSGVSRMDYRIVDPITDPPGYEDRCTERLIRLDRCFVCFGPVLQSTPEPRQREGVESGVVFASFNVLSKVTDSVVQAWADIVNGVSGSRLVLKAAALENSDVRADLTDRFARAGLEPSRLELLGWVKTDPLLMYARVDIGLDPFPYHGTTTTCEALWMGVPVVTIEGNTHASRVGSSLMRHADLDELVARDPDDYIHRAIKLGQSVERIHEFRRTLRDRVRSTIMDAPAFTRRFEAALNQMFAETVARS